MIFMGLMGLAAVALLLYQFYFARPRGFLVPFGVDQKSGTRLSVEVFPEPPLQPLPPPEEKTPSPFPPPPGGKK